MHTCYGVKVVHCDLIHQNWGQELCHVTEIQPGVRGSQFGPWGTPQKGDHLYLFTLICCNVILRKLSPTWSNYSIHVYNKCKKGRRFALAKLSNCSECWYKIKLYFMWIFWDMRWETWPSTVLNIQRYLWGIYFLSNQIFFFKHIQGIIILLSSPDDISRNRMQKY